MPGRCLGVDDRAGARRQGQRRAPVAECGPDEDQVTVHHSAQAICKPLSHAK
jgi:hypothetical protein